MYPILITLHVFVALGMIALILMQQGKGADIGSAFGAGASATLFGARGSANFLTRTTAILATVFFLNSILLAYLVAAEHKPTSLMERVTIPASKPSSDLPELPGAQAIPLSAVQPQTTAIVAPVQPTTAVVAVPPEQVAAPKVEDIAPTAAVVAPTTTIIAPTELPPVALPVTQTQPVVPTTPAAAQAATTSAVPQAEVVPNPVEVQAVQPASVTATGQ